MNRTKLETLRNQLNVETIVRQAHSGHSYEAGGIAFLFNACSLLADHLLDLDDEKKTEKKKTKLTKKKKK